MCPPCPRSPVHHVPGTYRLAAALALRQLAAAVAIPAVASHRNPRGAASCRTPPLCRDRRGSLRPFEGILEIADEIFDVLDSHGDAHEARRDAETLARLLWH